MFSILKISLAILAATQLAVAIPPNAIESRGNGCGAAGIANGQCGRIYSGDSCKGNDMLNEFKPNCERQCITNEKGIRSVQATGNGIKGTDCILYSDDKCSKGKEMGKTGNSIFAGQQKCKTAPNNELAKSVQCWFAC